MSSHRAQSSYQVRFEWGADGARAIADGVHAVVWVDELGVEQVPELGVEVVAGALRSADAVARWSLARQAELGGRFVIAVVAAGVRQSDGTLRFAVEDLLAAGAVIDAIAELGIDHQSPEAAAAASAYSGLRNATRHLVTASVSARELGGVQLELTPEPEVRRLR
ncbi:2-phosphosulfolactate phosphatase [Protaetiibacter mangrovi]|uniref:Probable 2-phosphosulfolactate phosphatase n=1 Tax=Protaetiibacter mangrovi TaxID=2970926 RepID=A0ABT1ZD21_9MICO|nr:2-phosphosulfolactate phosphatase [Protaetiibacter mangrovi]MCS0498609.1 2-phosphosulfolactate phosphatase [Protaetiibacter mangrovi]TPX05695.1 2-phosphosulfolactate phosphatase [Schumannella luteola]